MTSESAFSSEQAPSLPSSSPSIAGKNMMALIMLCTAAGVLAVFLLSLSGRYFYYGEVLCNFRLQLAVLMLPLALIVFRIGRWRWLAYSLAIAITWSFISVGSVYLPVAQPQAGPKKLKIMSFNLLWTNSMRDEVLAEINKPDPDVIVVLEYIHHWHRRLQELKSEYPHQILQPRWHGFGIAVFSKYPLSDTNVVQLTRDRMDNPTIITNVNFKGQKIRLCGLHVLSPVNSFRLELRNQQFEEVAEELNLKNVPTVVVGDFNSVSWSPFVRDFMEKTGYRDSRRGFGYHSSWHAEYPPLRVPIDHALVSDDVCVHSRTLGGYAGSDHLPIIFEVSTAKPTEDDSMN